MIADGLVGDGLAPHDALEALLAVGAGADARIEEHIQMEGVHGVAGGDFGGHAQDLFPARRVDAGQEPLAILDRIHRALALRGVHGDLDQLLSGMGDDVIAAELLPAPFRVARIQPVHVGDGVFAMGSQPIHDLGQIVVLA